MKKTIKILLFSFFIFFINGCEVQYSGVTPRPYYYDVYPKYYYPYYSHPYYYYNYHYYHYSRPRYYQTPPKPNSPRPKPGKPIKPSNPGQHYGPRK